MSDLSNLFLPPPVGPAQPAQFRQAVLLEFDADDGTNLVQIGTSEIPNLPLARTGAEIGLQGGDNILVMYLGNTAMIFCAIATPGSANYGASNNGRAGIARSVSGGFGSSLASVTAISDTSIVVPGWAHSASVALNGQAQLQNNSGGADFLGSQVSVSDPGTGNHFSALYFGTVPASAFVVTTALFDDVIGVTPEATLSISYRVQSDQTWAANSNNNASLTASFSFFRESAS
jgi:hypothetical protein